MLSWLPLRRAKTERIDAEAEALIGSDKIKPLVADFDRVWGDRVSRRREVLQIVQELAP